MKKQVLSISQCKELTDLGIDMSDASMYWIATGKADYSKELFKSQIREMTLEIFTDIHKEIWLNKETNRPDDIIPTFTLQDILKILPKNIDGGGWVLSERYSEIPGEGAYIWYGKKQIGVTDGYTPLEASFNMLKWCKQNNYNVYIRTN